MDDTPSEVVPSYAEFQDLISSDQRRILIIAALKSRQLDILRQILEQESIEAQQYFERWMSYQQNSQFNNERQVEDELDYSSDSSDNLSDSSDDDDDPRSWSPIVKPSFFDQFPKEVNILILGGTGVGKSTFINALANYLQFGNMYQAMTNFQFEPLRIECPSTCEENKGKRNENVVIGQSSTMEPKSYSIQWGPSEKKKIIRFIDTPGVGDVRGLKQEKENFAKTLKFVGKFKELHGICILMKPNESKLTLSFRYCLSELLTHLHASASQNILFCFTNTRQTFYQPGETLTTLKAYLKKLEKYKNIEISLDSLFKRISELRAHKVADTIMVNHIRTVTLTMVKSLIEISREQLADVQKIDEKLKIVNDCIKEEAELLKKPKVPQIVLKPKPFDHPMTVCTADECVEYYTASGHPRVPMQVCYKAICHTPCYVDGIQTELCPNPDIKQCLIFDRTEYFCKECGCGWEKHIQIQTKLEQVVTSIVDPAVQQALENCIKYRKAAESFIESKKNLRSIREKEICLINKYCSEFACFLKANSLLPYNDLYKEYYDDLINETKNAVDQGGSIGLIEVLELNKKAYDAQIHVINNRQKLELTKLSIEEFNRKISALKKLKSCDCIKKAVKELEYIKLEKYQIGDDINITLTGWFAEKFSRLVEWLHDVLSPIGTIARRLNRWH